ncbi:MAG: NAD(P)-binding domain-containing protein [Methylacidiphilales bacterium]|nr:NAD(P)-binding domain-containing protein [Candidatus Methylacidiphilales bacterium]
MNIHKVCVIGAGISGLTTAKTFIEEGYDVTVFEKQSGLGGVWEKSRTYPKLTTQNTRDTYCFSDYPMPESYSEFPTAKEMREYLESYASYFGVINQIHLKTEVTQVYKEVREEGKWIVRIKFEDNQASLKEEEHIFDFVIICNGTFNVPRVPSITGKEEFIASGGTILHSSQFTNTSLIQGKRVVVVGFGKSAADIANLAAETAKECSLVFRRVMWKIPKRFFNKIIYKDLLMTRFSEIWIPYRKRRGVEKLLHKFAKPLVWAFWRTNETIVRSQFKLDRVGMVPEVKMDKALTCNGNLAPDGFYEYINSGKIQAIKSSITRFLPNGVELANGKKINTDVVIFGTGFTQNISFLQEKYRDLLMNENGDFRLYRTILNPDVPNLAFIGYNSSFFCPLTSEVAAWWLLEYIKGNLLLPSPSQIHQEIDTEFTWIKRNLPKDLPIGTCVLSFSYHHLEDLIEDMGLDLHRKGTKQIQGIMESINPLAYQKIRQKLKNRNPQQNNYVGIPKR